MSAGDWKNIPVDTLKQFSAEELWANALRMEFKRPVRDWSDVPMAKNSSPGYRFGVLGAEVFDYGDTLGLAAKIRDKRYGISINAIDPPGIIAAKLRELAAWIEANT